MIRIREYRKRMGITMKELGAKVGVSESAVGNWENEKRRPSYEHLLQISEILDCSVNDLLGYDERPTYQEAAEYMPEITMIARAGLKMTPEKRADMLKILKTIYPEEFEL